MSIYIKKFSQLSKDDTAIAGGKGSSLGEMVQSGFPVPDGFVILADAFDAFSDKNDFDMEIAATLRKVKKDDINSAEKASKKINDLITDSKFPKDLEKEILREYEKLGKKNPLSPPFKKGEMRGSLVAVRSSATAEDSSVASWAGELESYMNVSKKNLLESVKKCWASLFMPRAIFYKYKKKLENQKVSVAVAVQKMIQSEVSGICFTVHPITEDQNQMVIEAGWGLGDAVVGGMITPDNYVVRKIQDTRDNNQINGRGFEILDVNVSEQKIMLVRSDYEHKEAVVPATKQNKQKLTGEQIVDLAHICAKIEDHYGRPQDIEWALKDGKFYILQSRPITTLGA